MVFNTGAALLDAIVLAVVSWTKDGTYGYKITRKCSSLLMYRNPRCTRCCGVCRKMSAWRSMTER